MFGKRIRHKQGHLVKLVQIEYSICLHKLESECTVWEFKAIVQFIF